MEDMPDSAPSDFIWAFISTKADAQMVAEVDSIDAWPAVEPRIYQAMSIASTPCGTAHLGPIALRHERENMKISAAKCRYQGARRKTGSRSEWATIGLAQKTIASGSYFP
jgi:hypothetical protein